MGWAMDYSYSCYALLDVYLLNNSHFVFWIRIDLFEEQCKFDSKPEMNSSNAKFEPGAKMWRDLTYNNANVNISKS